MDMGSISAGQHPLRLCQGPFWFLGVAILGARCLHFGVLGDFFNTSGASRGVILAPRDHAGGPWKQQCGIEMVVYRISFDLGVILDLCISTF